MKKYLKIILLFLCLPLLINASIPINNISEQTDINVKIILKDLKFIPHEGIP